MTIHNKMIEMINWRNEIADRSVSIETFKSEMQKWREIIKAQKLKREQFALQEMFNALVSDIYVKDITLAYEYNGTLYCTHKDYRNATVNGVGSTEYLHTLDLKSADWNALPKFHLWAKSGVKLAPVA